MGIFKYAFLQKISVKSRPLQLYQRYPWQVRTACTIWKSMYVYGCVSTSLFIQNGLCSFPLSVVFHFYSQDNLANILQRHFMCKKNLKTFGENLITMSRIIHILSKKSRTESSFSLCVCLCMFVLKIMPFLRLESILLKQHPIIEVLLKNITDKLIYWFEKF